MDNRTQLQCREFGANVISNTTSRNVGTVVSVSCKSGYSLLDEDVTVLTCQYTGIWNNKDPYCRSTSSDQVLIIVICSVASTIALFVLCCALYMLLSNCRKEQLDKEHRREILDTLRELSVYHAVTQDCVGMPPVVYDNMSSILRGRTSSFDETKPKSVDMMTNSEVDLATERAFIY